MDLELPEESQLLRDNIRRFVDQELIPINAEVERTREIPKSIIDQMKEMGLFGILTPEKYGGMGMTNVGSCVIQEELSRANLCYPLYISGNIGIGTMGILHFGNEEQKEKYLPRMASGELMSCFALTEPNAGSDASAIEAKAEKKGDKYVINGLKHFITRGDISDVFTVVAVTDKSKKRTGMSAFIVEKDSPGFSIGKIQGSMGSDICRQCELIFENCEVPAGNLLGEEGQGFGIAMQVLEEGRLSQGARCVGIARRLVELCSEHAQVRVQFGRTISEFQAIQWMLADMATEIYAMKSMVYDAAWHLDQGQRNRTRAAMVKLFCTETIGRIADRAVQVLGGMGYMQEGPVEATYREVRGMRIYEGTSEIQRFIIARDVLKNGLSSIGCD
ncbi:MAG: acyl-CoA dehydrogenase family protein [Deltaproteobacteria bacterium]|nr:acyl-CoA dehydrogenase family protein [Deltaproteobacteria bacterium]